MFQLFEDNASIAPRTYSIKGYKKKRSISIKKIILYITCILAAFLILGFTILSAYSMI